MGESRDWLDENKCYTCNDMFQGKEPRIVCDNCSNEYHSECIEVQIERDTDRKGVSLLGVDHCPCCTE